MGEHLGVLTLELCFPTDSNDEIWRKVLQSVDILLLMVCRCEPKKRVESQGGRVLPVFLFEAVQYIDIFITDSFGQTFLCEVNVGELFQVKLPFLLINFCWYLKVVWPTATCCARQSFRWSCWIRKIQWWKRAGRIWGSRPICYATAWVGGSPQHRPTKFADKNDQQMKQMNMAQNFFVGPANGWLILQLMTKSGSETKPIFEPWTFGGRLWLGHELNVFSELQLIMQICEHHNRFMFVKADAGSFFDTYFHRL